MRALLLGLAVVAVCGGCHAPRSPERAPSMCAQLGGTVGADEVCEIHEQTTTSTVDIRFPTAYPDEETVVDYIRKTRADFTDWIAASPTPARPVPFELDIIGATYRSGDRTRGTQSLVLTVGNDTGVHPVTTYKAFNYRVADHVPIGVETLFEPGSNPLAVLNPIVGKRILELDPAAAVAANNLTLDSYRQFAITDDAIIFFFNQDGLLPHEAGPFQVAVPRSALASILRP